MFKTYNPKIVKKDISNIPFEEITETTLDLYNEACSLILEKDNAALEKSYFSKYSSASEQVDDSTPDLKLLDSVDRNDPRVKAAFKDAVEEAISRFVDKYEIKKVWTYLGPQLLAHLGTYKVSYTPTPGSSDLRTKCIDPRVFVAENVTNDRERGIWLMITKVPRGKLMDKQTEPHHLPVCSLVPLYMAAQKKFNNIPYSHWSRDSLDQIVDKELAEAMLAAPTLGPTPPEELLLIRDVGLTYTTSKGTKAKRNPQTYHALINISESAIGNLPRYAKAMLCQIWCAHPSNRHEYMILDPYDWDNMPKPLIDDTPITPPTPTKPIKSRVESPWD